MNDPRIIDITLDEHTLAECAAEIEQERRIAIADLLEQNHFAPRRHHGDATGPWRLHLGVTEGRLAIAVRNADNAPVETHILGLTRLRRHIRAYFAMCESYTQAIHSSTTPDRIETVDMARRAFHNEAAEVLTERLNGKIDLDFETARRLFTLICALHIKM